MEKEGRRFFLFPLLSYFTKHFWLKVKKETARQKPELPRHLISFVAFQEVLKMSPVLRPAQLEPRLKLGACFLHDAQVNVAHSARDSCPEVVIVIWRLRVDVGSQDRPYGVIHGGRGPGCAGADF